MPAGSTTVNIIVASTDQATKVFKSIGGAAQDMEKKLDSASEATEETGKQTTSLGKAFEFLKGPMVAAGVVAAAKAAWQLGQLGAQSLRTKKSFEAISGGAGEAEKRLDAMKEATRGAMTEQQMMQSANVLMQMGLANNAEELENLTTMAVRLGTAMGRDAAGSIADFSMMLANQSIPRLDTFGISAGKVRTRIAELRAASKDMTREQAFMQAVMEEGGAAMERLGDSTEDDMLAFEQLSASTEDLKTAFAERLAPATAEVAKLLAGMARDVKEHRTGFDEYERALWGMGNTQERVAEVSSRNLMEAQVAVTEAIEAETEALEVNEKAVIARFKTARDWQETSQEGYLSYLEEKENLTIETEEAIAAIEAEYANAKYRNVEADQAGLEALAVEYAAKEARILRSLENAKTEEEKAYQQLRLDQLHSSHQEEASSLQAHTVMVSGLTREQADERIAALQEGMADELATMEEGWAEQRAEQRKHFAEMQVAYLENQLATGDMSEEQQAVAAEALRALQLEFGLTTEDALAMTDAEVVLRDMVKGMAEEDVPAWVDAMGKFQEATEDGKVTTEEAKDVVSDLDDEIQGRFLEIFPSARTELDKVTSSMWGLHAATEAAYGAMSGMSSAGASVAGAAPGYQHGTSSHRGGMALVGEAGPEVVALPRGSAVYPSHSPVTKSVTSSTTYNTTINDRLAAQLFLEQTRQQQMERANALM